MKDGDKISIDIPKRRLDVELSKNEIDKRMRQWRKPPLKAKKGYLARYGRMVSSANKGAVWI